MRHTKNFENKKPSVPIDDKNSSNTEIQTDNKPDPTNHNFVKKDFRKITGFFSFSKNETKYDPSKTTADFNAMIRIVILNSLGFFFFGFVIPFVTYSLLNATGLEMGFVFAGQVIGGLISYPIVGYLTDRVSKKKLVLFGSTGRGIAYVLMYFGIYMGSLSFFAFGIFVQGFMVGFFWTPFDVMISQKSNKHNRSYAFGKRGGGIGRGNLVGSIASVLIFTLASTFDPGDNLIIYSPLLIFCVSNIIAGFLFNRQVDENLLFHEEDENDIKINNVSNASITQQFPINPKKKPPLITEFDKPVNKPDKKENNKPDKKENNKPDKKENNKPDKKENNKPDKDKNKLSKIMSLSLITGYIFLAVGFFLSSVNSSVRNPFIQSYLLNTITKSGTIVMIIYFPSVIIAQLAAPKLGEFADRIKPSIGISFTSVMGSLSTFLLISTNNGVLFSIFLVSSSTFSLTGTLILRNILSRLSIKNRGKIFGWFMWFNLLGGALGPIVGGIAWDSLGIRYPFILSVFLELCLIPIYLIAIRYLKNHMAEKLD